MPGLLTQHQYLIRQEKTKECGWSELNLKLRAIKAHIGVMVILWIIIKMQLTF